MDYEKKYKEALKKAREIKEKIMYSHLSTESCKAVSEYIDTIIPELAESEDERIRKELIETIRCISDDCSVFLSEQQKQRYLSYLEKQKEQKYTEGDNETEIQKAFREGKSAGRKEVFDHPEEYGLQREQKPLKVGENAYFDPNTDMWFIKKEQKPAEINEYNIIKKHITEDVISSEVNKRLKECGWYVTDEEPVEWSEEDETYLTNILIMLKEYLIHHYSKDDIDKSVDWLENRVKFLRSQPKQVWSEEDEKMRQSIIKDIEFERNYTEATTGRVIGKFNEQIAWLKDLPFNLKKKNEDVAKLSLDEWSEEDEDVLQNIIQEIEWERRNTTVDKDIRNYDRQLNFLKSLRPRLKQGWSKKEQTIIEGACNALEIHGHSKLADKLKSLRPQPKQEWSEEDYREEDIQTRFAFYTYKDELGTLYLSNVFVEEASRNHGFGTKILAAAEKVAETIGATTISLKVKQDSPANAWYRKNGYGYVAFEDGYDWLEKNLEYMKPNKQVWSEEDRRTIDRACVALRAYANGELPDILPSEILEYADKLQSLRPSWKPSEEQMKALEDAFRKDGSDEYRRTINSLYQDLKKL